MLTLTKSAERSSRPPRRRGGRMCAGSKALLVAPARFLLISPVLAILFRVPGGRRDQGGHLSGLNIHLSSEPLKSDSPDCRQASGTMRSLERKLHSRMTSLSNLG